MGDWLDNDFNWNFPELFALNYLELVAQIKKVKVSKYESDKLVWPYTLYGQVTCKSMYASLLSNFFVPT